MRRPAGLTALGLTQGAARPAGCQAGSAASLPAQSVLDPSFSTESFSSLLSESLGLGLPASASLHQVLRRLARSCKELPLWRCWGPGDFADSSAADVGAKTSESPGACSPHTPGPLPSKFPRLPLLPHRWDQEWGQQRQSPPCLSICLTPTNSSSPAALSRGSGSTVFSVASSGTAAAPAPGVEPGIEESGRSPPPRPPGLLVLRWNRCRLYPRCRRRRQR